MNVTERGYYTSTYLDSVNRNKPRRKKDDVRGIQKKISEYSLSNQGPASPETQMTKSVVTGDPSPGQETTRTTPSFNKSTSSYKTRNEVDTSSFLPESPETQYTESAYDIVDTEPIDPDDLHEELTPAQLNILQKRQSSRPRRRRRRHSFYDDESRYNAPIESRDYAYEDYDSRYEDDSRYDGDSYYDRRSTIYDEYYNSNQRYRLPTRPSRQDHNKQPHRRQGDDYYIKQKQRYDEAEFYKPKNYTHKTFREVFNDNDGELSRFNPMEYVFDDPEKIKEQEENQKLKKAFKTIQVKLGKDDYSNYDYYENKNKKSNAANEVFVTGEGSDDSDDEKINVTGEEQPKPKKKKNLKKLWKSKTKQIKSELGKDYFKNMEKQWEMEEAKKRLKELEMLAEVESAQVEDDGQTAPNSPKSKIEEVANQPLIEEPDSASDKTKFYAGPKADFHPAWNYLLSWLVYEQPKPSHQDNGERSIEEAIDIEQNQKSSQKTKNLIPSLKSSINPSIIQSSKKPIIKPPEKKKSPKKIKITRDQMKNFNKNVLKLKNMWNQPASHMFNGQVNAVNGGTSVRNHKGEMVTITESLPQSSDFDIPQMGDAQEFVIELEDDDSDFDEELFFNPLTGQLEREPPTSYSSMEYASRTAGSQSGPQSSPGSPTLTLGSKGVSSRNISLLDSSNGAKAIISNINLLIKSIKLFKIVFAPIDVIAESFPNLQTIVIMIELVIFMWMLYELSLLIDALCMMVKAVCAPMIAMGRFMNRIM